LSNTYTNNVNLAKPAFHDEGWSVPLNANCDALDALAPVGGLAVTSHEQPSSSLLVDVAGGSYVKQDGTIGTYAGVSSQAIPTATTKTLYLDGAASFALVVGSAYPSTPHVRLATVVAGATTISSVTDNRLAFGVAGSIADGANLVFGTSTGTQIGTGSTQKLSFYGATPIVRPTMGAATAGATYTSAEQAMLNAVYSAVRALGLGS
jgi:hypothetical protein